MYRIKLKCPKIAKLYWSTFHCEYVEDGKGEQLYSEEDKEDMPLGENEEWERFYEEDISQTK